MPAPAPIVERKWYRIAESLTAVGALVALGYFLLVSRGWLAGESPRQSSLLQFASTTCFLVSFVARRRSLTLAIVAQGVAVIFLAWSIGSLGRGN